VTATSPADAPSSEPSSLRRNAVLAALAIAIVAGALFVSRAKPTGEPPLPDYALESLGGTTSTHAGDTRVATALQTDGTVRVDLRLVPLADVAGAVEVHLLLERSNGDAVVAAQIANADHGAYRVTVPGAALAGTPVGDATLVAFVARAGVLADEPAALRAMETNANVRVLRQPLRILPPRRPVASP
jgi:hypothetical protein